MNDWFFFLFLLRLNFFIRIEKNQLSAYFVLLSFAYSLVSFHTGTKYYILNILRNYINENVINNSSDMNTTWVTMENLDHMGCLGN